MPPAEGLHVLLNDILCRHSLRLPFFAGGISKASIDFLKHIKCQGFWLAILLGNIIDGVNRILVSSLGEQVSGSFGEFENENTNEGKCKG